MRLRLFTKFLLLLIPLAVIPAALVGLRTLSINRVGMQDAILELHTHIASYLADEVQTNLKTLDREIQYILRTLSTQMSWNDRQAVLQALLDTNENFIAVSIVDTKGQELLKAYNPAMEKDPQLLSRADDETFKRFWANPKASALSHVYFLDNDPRINIVYPLGPGHALYTTVTLQNLWNRITQTRIATTGTAFMVDETGAIIAHPNINLARERTSALSLPIVRQGLKAVSVGSSEYEHPITHKRIVGAYAPIKGLSWGIIIQQDKAEAYTAVYRMRKQAAVLIITISIGSALLLAPFIARWLTKPIVQITEAARHISRKEFATRVSIRTHDELRDLAETFNDMTAELERYDQMQVDKIVEEKSKTDAVIFSIADGIVMTDPDGRVQIANRQARDILGIPEEGWQNQPVNNLVKRDKLKEAFLEIMRQPEQSLSREVNLSQPDATCFYLLTTEPVVSPQNRDRIGMVTVLRNITLERELDRMKDDFLHSITHDLRNPMTSIRGFLKFLNDGVAGPLNEQQKKMLSIMDRASLRLLVLINDILDIAKLEAGRMTLSLTECDMKPIAQRALEISEGLALKKQIKLVLDAPDTLPVSNCDPELIERVFINLVSNSLKFTPEAGMVTIRLRTAGDKIEGAVIDTGEGIPPDYVESIFDKFKQVAGQRKGGTGLGLTICKHIVEAHLGRIWAESKLGEGATFIFQIPKNLSMNDIMSHKMEAAANETMPH